MKRIHMQKRWSALPIIELAVIISLTCFGVFHVISFLNAEAFSVTAVTETITPPSEIFSNIHASQRDMTVSSEPYFNDPDIGISWDYSSYTASALLEISRNPDFSDLIAVVRGNEPGFCGIPSYILGNGGRFYYRLRSDSADDAPVIYSPVNWFAWDSKFAGIHRMVNGDHPLGKSEASICVRDGEGNLHLVVPHQYSDMKTQNILWYFSDDDGQTWTARGPVNLPEHRFSKAASITYSAADNMLYVAYLAGQSMRMPMPVCICQCDLSEAAPRFSGHHTFLGRNGLAWRKPFMDTDTSGTVHMCWDAPPSTGLIHFDRHSIFYTNNHSETWLHPISLADNNAGGLEAGSNLACIGTTVHVLWEGGAWRWSNDYGTTWHPDLADDPEFVIPPSRTPSGLRWRCGTSTTIPGRDAIAVVLIGERISGETGQPWMKYLNFDELWLTVFEPESGWSDPKCVLALDDNPMFSPDISETQHVVYLERPDISCDGTQTLYIAWDETEGYGPVQEEYRRAAYITETDLSGKVLSAKPLPVVDDLCGMKPLLGAPRSEPGCDIVWAVGEMPRSDLRPIRNGMDSTLAGIMFCTMDNVDQHTSESFGYLGEFHSDVSNDGFQAAPPFPEICLPELSHSASPPTWTPDPPTP
ncbi:hypothetical protein JW979_06305, partial [bacterium]|nr:hypothetical protein [candidate division CSSED10-310 bacterium]